MSAPAAPHNPYVGPRAFKRDEPLPARDREKRQLSNLLRAERIVLLHAPSGAGKTSLINAALGPMLDDKRFRATPALRVNTPPPAERDIHNRYVHSVALGLLDGEQAPARIAHLTLPQVMEAAAPHFEGRYPVLMLDQFEEILVINPADREGQEEFFAELGDVLADGSVWALLSMREDYMGGLARFLRYIPGNLATRYRLDFLEREAAAVAIQKPARDQQIEFSDEAAGLLVEKLATATVQTPGGGAKEVPAPYVQPVQLQVVCRSLWRSVRLQKRAKGEPFREIDVHDAEQVDIPKALRGYYAGVVKDVAQTTGADELAIRRWFESELISPQRYRSQTLTGPQSGDVDPKEVLTALEAGYLIRGDRRGDSTWWELAHDKMVMPVVQDNADRMLRHLAPWQLAAREWAKSPDPSRLLGPIELRAAQRQAEKGDLNEVERSFLDASRQAEHDRSVLSRAQSRVSFIGLIAAAELLIIVVLVILLLQEVT